MSKLSNKRIILVTLFIISFFLLLWGAGTWLNNYGKESHRKLQVSLKYERDGRNLIKQGNYLGALKKYSKSIDDDLTHNERDKVSGLAAIVKIYQHLGDLEKASNYLDEYRATGAPLEGFYRHKKPELEAYIKMQETGVSEPIYEHISWYMKEYARFLPPNGFRKSKVFKIIKLYADVNDFKAGMEYLDKALGFVREERLKKGDPADFLFSLNSAKDTASCMKNSQSSEERSICKNLHDFYVVRDALQAIKVEENSVDISDLLFRLSA